MAIKQVVSIEITDATTKMAFKSYGKPQPVLYQTVYFENKEHVVEDGYIKDKASFGISIKKALSVANISCKDLIFILSGTKIVSREITAPAMKPKLLQDFIENNRSEYFPMDTTGYVFTYAVLEELKDEEKQRIMIYAAPGDMIKNYEDFAVEMGYNVVAIDYTGNAIYQWLKAHEGPNDMYLQVNERNSIMTIMNGGRLALQRMMSFGAANVVNKYIENAPAKDITFQTALTALQEDEVLYPDFDFHEAFNSTGVLRSEVTNAVRPLIQQITQVLEYYSTKNKEAEISRVFLGGCGAEMENFVPLLKSEFPGLEFVTRLKPADVKLDKNCDLPEWKVSEYIGAFGASQSSINFSNLQVKKDFQKVVRLCIVAFVLVVLASGVMVAGNFMDLKTAEKANTRYQKRYDELKGTGIDQLVALSNASSSMMDEMKGLNDATFSHNENWNDILKYLEENMVTGTLVSSITSSSTGLTMNISVNTDQYDGDLAMGEADAKIKAARIIQGLKAIPYFSSVTVNSVAITNDDVDAGDVRYVRTTITFSAYCEYQKYDKNAETEEK